MKCLRLMPAQKDLSPAPVITTTRTSRSLAIASSTWFISLESVGVMQLRIAGLFRVTRAIPWLSTFTLTCSSFGNLSYDNKITGSNGSTDSRNWLTFLQGQINDTWNSRLELGQSYDRNKAVGATMPWNNGLNATTRHSASWLNRFDLNPANELTLGGDWYEDKLDSSTDYAEDSRSNSASLVTPYVACRPRIRAVNSTKNPNTMV